MNALNHLKIGFKLALIVVVFTIGFIGFGIYAFGGINTIKVNGPIYAQVVRGKDIIADILPPPEYIIESYLNCLQMLEAVDAQADRATIDGLVDKAEALRKDYDARHAYWIEELEEGRLKDLLVDASYLPAKAFYDIRDEQFIPAIRAGELTARRGRS
jgi:methyl-accepting chemotaxis protein